MAPVPAQRIRALNTREARPDGTCVLYWMVAARRLSSNFGLQRAAEWAIALQRPLVIFEPLRVDYRWASDRLHRFVIEGMADHHHAMRSRPATYVPHVEHQPGDGRRLLDALVAQAAVVVTDDYPAFFVPGMLSAAGRRIAVRLEAVDSNGLLPMRLADRTFPTAFAFRAHVQRSLRACLAEWPADIAWDRLPPPVALALPDDAGARPTPGAALAAPDALIASLDIDHSVGPVNVRGGTAPAAARLAHFVTNLLPRYTDDHNHPDIDGTSRLSPYLHFGHLSAHDVFTSVMTAERWTSRKLALSGGGKREGWWGVSAGAEAFLDQLITWRELGFNMCVRAPETYDQYESLPPWARATLDRHAGDPRPSRYSTEALARADTHDPVWNAAQRQLVREGWMHNYLRMLWGKKILEWSDTPESALTTMIQIMNRYALDGRDPNSYAGYGWTLGRYDRPWGPERPIFGTVRYMSSENTVRKLKIKAYLQRFGAEAVPESFLSSPSLL
ncbi:MAG: deoxyribodipyrimidine photolyase [Acidobacteriota bacterium]